MAKAARQFSEKKSEKFNFKYLKKTLCVIRCPLPQNRHYISDAYSIHG